jgi:hypothetical protein
LRLSVTIAFRYGGIFESHSREYTLDDFYGLQLDKMERFVCLKKSDVIIGVDDESSSDDEDEEEDEGEDEGEDEEDEEDDGDKDDQGVEGVNEDEELMEVVAQPTEEIQQDKVWSHLSAKY